MIPLSTNLTGLHTTLHIILPRPPACATLKIWEGTGNKGNIWKVPEHMHTDSIEKCSVHVCINLSKCNFINRLMGSLHIIWGLLTQSHNHAATFHNSTFLLLQFPQASPAQNTFMNFVVWEPPMKVFSTKIELAPLTYTNDLAFHESFLPKILTSYWSTKVFSLCFLLYDFSVLIWYFYHNYHIFSLLGAFRL